jgi:hypothetical protein
MPTLRLDGDASGAVKATGDVARAAQGLNQEFTKTIQTSEQIREQLEKAFNEKPIDTYVRKCDELAKKLAEGKINAHQYKEQTDNLARSLSNAGQVQEQSFGGAAISNLASYAAGTITIGKAIQFVTEALREQNAEKEKARKLDEASLPAAGQLSAAGGTEEDLEYARKLHKQGIVKSDEEGMRAVTGMVKADLPTADRDYLANLADQQLVAPGNMGEYAQNVRVYQKSFGEKDAGSFQDAEKKIRTAGRDTRLGSEEVALQMAKVAPVAKDAGMTDEEAMATFIVQSNRSADKKHATSETIERIKNGDKFMGDAGVEYAKELQRIQGAPTATELPSLTRTDPRLRAADSAGDAQAQYDADLAENTSETTSLYARLHTLNRQNIRRNVGYGVRGGVGVAVDKTIEKTGAALGQEESALHTAAESTGVYPKEFTDELKAHFERQTKAIERQTEIMERDGRSPPGPSGRQE